MVRLDHLALILWLGASTVWTDAGRFGDGRYDKTSFLNGDNIDTEDDTVRMKRRVVSYENDEQGYVDDADEEKEAMKQTRSPMGPGLETDTGDSDSEFITLEQLKQMEPGPGVIKRKQMPLVHPPTLFGRRKKRRSPRILLHQPDDQRSATRLGIPVSSVTFPTPRIRNATRLRMLKALGRNGTTGTRRSQEVQPRAAPVNNSAQPPNDLKAPFQEMTLSKDTADHHLPTESKRKRSVVPIILPIPYPRLRSKRERRMGDNEFPDTSLAAQTSLGLDGLDEGKERMDDTSAHIHHHPGEVDSLRTSDWLRKEMKFIEKLLNSTKSNRRPEKENGGRRSIQVNVEMKPRHPKGKVRRGTDRWTHNIRGRGDHVRVLAHVRSRPSRGKGQGQVRVEVRAHHDRKPQYLLKALGRSIAYIKRVRRRLKMRAENLRKKLRYALLARAFHQSRDTDKPIEYRTDFYRDDEPYYDLAASGDGRIQNGDTERQIFKVEHYMNGREPSRNYKRKSLGHSLAKLLLDLHELTSKMHAYDMIDGRYRIHTPDYAILDSSHMPRVVKVDNEEEKKALIDRLVQAAAKRKSRVEDEGGEERDDGEEDEEEEEDDEKDGEYEEGDEEPEKEDELKMGVLGRQDTDEPKRSRRSVNKAFPQEIRVNRPDIIQEMTRMAVLTLQESETLSQVNNTEDKHGAKVLNKIAALSDRHRNNNDNASYKNESIGGGTLITLNKKIDFRNRNKFRRKALESFESRVDPLFNATHKTPTIVPEIINMTWTGRLQTDYTSGRQPSSNENFMRPSAERLKDKLSNRHLKNRPTIPLDLRSLEAKQKLENHRPNVYPDLQWFPSFLFTKKMKSNFSTGKSNIEEMCRILTTKNHRSTNILLLPPCHEARKLKNNPFSTPTFIILEHRHPYARRLRLKHRGRNRGPIFIGLGPILRARDFEEVTMFCRHVRTFPLCQFLLGNWIKRQRHKNANHKWGEEEFYEILSLNKWDGLRVMRHMMEKAGGSDAQPDSANGDTVSRQIKIKRLERRDADDTERKKSVGEKDNDDDDDDELGRGRRGDEQEEEGDERRDKKGETNSSRVNTTHADKKTMRDKDVLRRMDSYEGIALGREKRSMGRANAGNQGNVFDDGRTSGFKARNLRQGKVKHRCHQVLDKWLRFKLQKALQTAVDENPFWPAIKWSGLKQTPSMLIPGRIVCAPKRPCKISFVRQTPPQYSNAEKRMGDGDIDFVYDVMTIGPDHLHLFLKRAQNTPARGGSTHTESLSAQKPQRMENANLDKSQPWEETERVSQIAFSSRSGHGQNNGTLQSNSININKLGNTTSIRYEGHHDASIHKRAVNKHQEASQDVTPKEKEMKNDFDTLMRMIPTSRLERRLESKLKQDADIHRRENDVIKSIRHNMEEAEKSDSDLLRESVAAEALLREIKWKRRKRRDAENRQRQGSSDEKEGEEDRNRVEENASSINGTDAYEEEVQKKEIFQHMDSNEGVNERQKRSSDKVDINLLLDTVQRRVRGPTELEDTYLDDIVPIPMEHWNNEHAIHSNGMNGKNAASATVNVGKADVPRKPTETGNDSESAFIDAYHKLAKAQYEEHRLNVLKAPREARMSELQKLSQEADVLMSKADDTAWGSNSEPIGMLPGASMLSPSPDSQLQNEEKNRGHNSDSKSWELDDLDLSAAVREKRNDAAGIPPTFIKYRNRQAKTPGQESGPTVPQDLGDGNVTVEAFKDSKSKSKAKGSSVPGNQRNGVQVKSKFASDKTTVAPDKKDDDESSLDDNTYLVPGHGEDEDDVDDNEVDDDEGIDSRGGNDDEEREDRIEVDDNGRRQEPEEEFAFLEKQKKVSRKLPTRDYSWGEWSSCSKSCGIGQRFRSNLCGQGNPCTGSDASTEVELCSDKMEC